MASKLNVYRVIPPGLNTWEREFGEYLDGHGGDTVLWWHRNPCVAEVRAGTPLTEPCLQAADYFLWAVQRFYERSEERYVELIWPQVGEIYDLDMTENNRRGVFYRKDKPLNLAARQAQKRSRGI